MDGSERSGLGTALLLGAIGYFLWCAYYYHQHRVWSWAPWKAMPVSRRIQQLPEHKVTRSPGNNSMETVSLIVP